jgi:hypothetical protein
MEHFPDWLGHDLVAGVLPWEQGVPCSLATFLERHQLHDARWIGLYAEPEQSATLLLEWGDYPGQPDSPHREVIAIDAPVLAVRFDSLERSEIKLRDHVLASVISGATNRAADSHRTQLVDRHRGEATLLHSPGVRLLCLSRSREVLPLLVPAETV